MKPGPPPVPTRLKMLRGETRPSRLNRQEPEPVLGMPSPPPDMSIPARQVWERVAREFGHTGVIRGADQDILRAYCEAVVRYEFAARMLEETGPLLVDRVHPGQMQKNPLHQVVRDNAYLMRMLAGELGLTPAARVGLQSGGDNRPARTKLQELIAKSGERRARRSS